MMMSSPHGLASPTLNGSVADKMDENVEIMIRMLIEGKREHGPFASVPHRWRQ